MPSWLDDVIKAVDNRGGEAKLSEIYEEVRLIRGEELTREWEASVRATIETHSADSKRFSGKAEHNIFYAAEGIGKGIWGLREQIRRTPIASDVEQPKESTRTKIETYRILRDTSLTRRLKKLHDDSCQICGLALRLSGRTYSEAHHIKPLGNPHNGPDVAENILVLCPNHHVMLDFRAKALDLTELRKKPTHRIASEFVNYHNALVEKGPDNYPSLFL